MEGKTEGGYKKKIAYVIVCSKVLVRWFCRLYHVLLRVILRAGENQIIIYLRVLYFSKG